ncbi:caspase-1-like isoform X2 [Octopus vulgaris]|uniref:Caspase-1-like isoform X2 n=1 Tax=Octopus vulgaris TaxID=6645 RepID=A0AA36B062_OCTVU|nr:caspase-1-like isoform X2 [Octopus vulgaris]
MKYFAVYEMTQNKRRVAYIFKNKPFPKDEENIRNALKVLGFNETDIKVHTFEEMPMVSKEFNDDDIDCIFCVILKNVELDNEFTDVAEVHNLLSYLKTDKCPLLAGIPKLIFVEASRGNALDSANIKVQVKQTRPGTMQDALASALEFELYIKSSTGNFRVSCSSGFQAKRENIRETEGLGNSHGPCGKDKEMTGVCCWHCGRPGHKRQDCYSLKRENAEQ